MSLEKILQALEAEGVHRVAEIQQTTQAEIERIQAQAQAQAEIVRQKRLEAIRAPLQTERARILNQAKLSSMQRVLGTREDMMTAALEAAANQLMELPNLESYRQLLQQLLQEAVDTLGICERLHLCVQNQDVELMKAIVQELGLSAVVEGDLENNGLWGADLGGVVATTPDERIRLVNTLEVRLQRVASLYRAQIAEMFFNHKLHHEGER
jgi:V/A-type H+-transporting ATPase subunit E